MYGENGLITETRLVHGRFEGALKVRIAGKTEWQPIWAVASGLNMDYGSGLQSPGGGAGIDGGLESMGI